MDTFTFNPDAHGYDSVNAYTLGHCAEIAYNDDVNELESSFKKWGFNKFKFINTHETQCYVAAKEDLLIVAFRGTEPTKVLDILADANAAQTDGPWGKVHMGFNIALDFCWNELTSTLAEFTTDSAETKVWITGHSLGGALAALATARLRQQEITDVAGTYTFGQPRVGDKEFSRQYDHLTHGRHIRFVNNNDIVTQVPPTKVDFKIKSKTVKLQYDHVGEMGYFKTDEELTFDIGKFGLIIDHALGFKEGGFKDELNDHSMTCYNACLKKNLTA